MNIATGLLIIIVIGILQGSFIYPMTLTKNWKWEHNWFTFSLFAMIILNWIIAFAFLPNLMEIIFKIPISDLLIVLIFGLIWGAGAILFGKGMDMLGMALGYPIIMGLSACIGTFAPAVIFSPEIFLQLKGILIIAGTLTALAGITLCGIASSKKSAEKTEGKKKNYKIGLIIAITSGVTSCLPNIGAAFSKNITAIALEEKIPELMAGNVVWSLFFTTGFIANAAYCLYLMFNNKDKELCYFNEFKTRNFLLIFIMSLMWIISFYFYGIGSHMLGNLGLIVGWPIFIILSIVVGNILGIWRGEWENATAISKKLLRAGMLVLITAIIIIALSNK